MTAPTLFSLPADQLLIRFGEGKATPGSGCAAALMALLASQLTAAIARMTIQRGKQDAAARYQLILDAIDDRIAPRLRELFEEDAQAFEKVIEARRARDCAEDDAAKRKYTALASAELKAARDILFEISELSFQILDNALWLWNIGFQPAMGEAGAGISAAVAAITTCVLVIGVNIRTARSIWARESKIRCDNLIDRLNMNQNRVLQLIGDTMIRSERALDLPLSS